MKAACLSLMVLAGTKIMADCAGGKAHMSSRELGFSPQLQEIALLSHSLTDGNTWPYLVRQALTDAGRPEPILINAAGGGDTAGSEPAAAGLGRAAVQARPGDHHRHRPQRGAA